MTLDIYTLAGFAGAVIVVAAYFANQMGRLPSNDWRFPGANLLGSLLILISFYTGWNFPSVVIELFWVAISVYGLARRARAA